MAAPERCERERSGERHETSLSWRPTKYGYFWLCPACWEEIQREFSERS